MPFLSGCAKGSCSLLRKLSGCTYPFSSNFGSPGAAYAGGVYPTQSGRVLVLISPRCSYCNAGWKPQLGLDTCGFLGGCCRLFIISS